MSDEVLTRAQIEARDKLEKKVREKECLARFKEKLSAAKKEKGSGDLAKSLWLMIPNHEYKVNALRALGFTSLREFVTSLGDSKGPDTTFGLLITAECLSSRLFAKEENDKEAIEVAQFLIQVEGWKELLQHIPSEFKSRCLEKYENTAQQITKKSAPKVVKLGWYDAKNQVIPKGYLFYLYTVFSQRNRKHLDQYGFSSPREFVESKDGLNMTAREFARTCYVDQCRHSYIDLMRQLVVDEGWSELLDYVPEQYRDECGADQKRKEVVEKYISESVKNKSGKGFVLSIYELVKEQERDDNSMRMAGYESVRTFISGEKYNKKKKGLGLDAETFVNLAFAYDAYREQAKYVINYLSTQEKWTELFQYIPSDSKSACVGELRLSTHGGDRKSEAAKQDTISTSRGTSKSYVLLKLARDAENDPEVAQVYDQVKKGTLTASKAAVQLGWRKPQATIKKDVPSAIKTLKKLFTPEELEQIREGLA